MRKWVPVILVLAIVILLVAGWFWLTTPKPATAPAAQETTAPLKEQKIYLIALDNGGEQGEFVGCNDSLVSVTRWLPSEGDPLFKVYEDLLALRDEKYQATGLYNALWKSQLSIDSAVIEGGVARVALSGSLVAGEPCDESRIKAQLERLPTQFADVTKVEVTVNGQAVEDAF